MESLLAAPLVGFRMLETTSSITSSAAKKSPIKSSVHRFRRSNLRRPQALKVSADYSCFEVKDVSYRPPGTQHNLLNDVSFSLREKSLGLIFGRSGSGKTTLLQLLAGLSKPTTGSINIQGYGEDGKPNQSPEQLPPERIGIVFQFPERYFLADTVLEEVTFGWPRQRGGSQLKEQLALGLQRAINAVGLNGISLDEDPHALSGGYKRRLALAVQLGCSTAVWDRGLRAQKQLPHAGVRLRTSDPPQSPHWRESGALVQAPDLLILDEPLAGLDWKARADVVKLLRYLKKELTLLVVSHDLKELSSLVDQSWRMEMGGLLREEAMPV